jgi:hypothetical protein
MNRELNLQTGYGNNNWNEANYKYQNINFRRKLIVYWDNNNTIHRWVSMIVSSIP